MLHSRENRMITYAMIYTWYCVYVCVWHTLRGGTQRQSEKECEANERWSYLWSWRACVRASTTMNYNHSNVGSYLWVGCVRVFVFFARAGLGINVPLAYNITPVAMRTVMIPASRVTSAHLSHRAWHARALSRGVCSRYFEVCHTTTTSRRAPALETRASVHSSWLDLCVCAHLICNVNCVWQQNWKSVKYCVRLFARARVSGDRVYD